MNIYLSGRRYTIGGIFVGVMLVYLVRLFYIQVMDSSYRDSADNNSHRYVTIYPARGLVYDRNHKLLVYNVVAYDLMVIPRQLKDFDEKEICELVNVTPEELRSSIQKATVISKYRPTVIKKQLSAEMYARLQEKMYKYPGFYVQARTIRTYPLKTAGHILGYISEVDSSKIKKDHYYAMGDYIGQSGIEKTYEHILRGKKGINIFLVDVHNRIQGSYRNGKFDSVAVAGKNITSSLDADLQEYGEKLMKNKRGSIVAIEPSTGEILAYVSSPTYDPNLLVGPVRSQHYKELRSDTLKPLFDRAAMASYPPGSTFKLINALIGLQEGVATPSTRYTCAGGYHVGGFSLKCHHNSSFDLETSIQMSCNAYYCYEYRSILDNRKYPSARDSYVRWREYVNSFGLGLKLDCDLPNVLKGLVPKAEYFDRKFGGASRWKSMMLISLSIGQGELGVTPLQMANMAAAIANRGYYYIPHLVKGIQDGAIDTRFTKRQDTQIDPRNFEVVINGMEKVVLAGTATSARIPGIAVCGKTGTAQNPHGEDHSIFLAFAPKENPKIAISVYVENGGFGATWAAPIASLMMEKYIRKKIAPERKDVEQRMMSGVVLPAFYRRMMHIKDTREIKETDDVQDIKKLIEKPQIPAN